MGLKIILCVFLPMYVVAEHRSIHGNNVDRNVPLDSIEFEKLKKTDTMKQFIAALGNLYDNLREWQQAERAQQLQPDGDAQAEYLKTKLERDALVDMLHTAIANSGGLRKDTFLELSNKVNEFKSNLLHLTKTLSI